MGKCLKENLEKKIETAHEGSVQERLDIENSLSKYKYKDLEKYKYVDLEKYKY